MNLKSLLRRGFFLVSKFVNKVWYSRANSLNNTLLICIKLNPNLDHPMKSKCMVLVFLISTATGALFGQSDCFPFIENSNPVVTVDCSSSVPGFTPVNITAACCDGPLSTHEVIVETGNILSSCNVNTAFGPGPDWAIWLPGVHPADVSWHFDSPGSMEVYGDGYAVITGHIHNASDPAQGFDVFFLLRNKRNWQEWSALGRGYKNDLGLAGDAYQNWDYYEMEENFCYLSGTGSLEGSFLELTHKPTNYYFGYQVGTAANNKNSNFGISGWFYYNGTINGNSISGHGDINADLACNTPEDPCGSTAFTKFISASACGNTSYAMQVVQQEDTTAPVFEEISSPVITTCEDLSSLSVSATDDCSSVTISYSDQVIEEGCNGLIERTYTATDGCGNSTEMILIIDLQSSEPLAFTNFPDDIEAECGQWSNNEQPSISFTGGCGNVVISFNDEIIPGDCGLTYTLVRTFTITDACGESVSQNWTVQITDHTPPTLFNVPADTFISCGDEIPAAEVFATDQCDGIATVSLTAETLDDECGYIFVRTWTATDGCGNSVSASQYITVTDNTPPVFTEIPGGATYACSDMPTEVELPSAEDACSEVEVSYSDEVLQDGCMQTITRTFTATDACGNSVSTSIEIFVGDNTPPSFGEAPGIIELACGEAADFIPEITDECGDVFLETNDISLEDCGGSFIREYIATDGCQNQSILTIQFNITDTDAPFLISGPEDIFLSCGNTQEPEWTEPVFADACSGIEVVYSGEALENFICEGSYQLSRTWIAFDACGNHTAFIQNIFYMDNEGPEFVNVPEDRIAECGQEIPVENPTAIDVCSGETENIEFSEIVIPDACGSSIIRTWTATDDCGNSSSVSQTITFRDTQAPEFNFYPEDLQLQCGETIPVAPNLVATDNCAGTVNVFVSESAEQGSCAGESVITRNYQATDLCGNTTVYTQTITISDTSAPVFVNPEASVEVSCTNFQLPLIYVEDDCANFELFFEDNQIIPGCGGLIERTYTATDGCGNSSQFVQAIQLVDDIAPVLMNLPPAELTIECGSTIPDVFIFAQDNCSGIVPVGLQATTEDNGCTTLFTRTWFAMDDCGNISQFSQVITSVDNTAPVLSEYPQNITISCDQGLPLLPQIIANDACDGFVNVEFQEETVGVGLCPQVIRTWCAEDCSGNEVCHSQTITFTGNNPGTASPFFRVVSDAGSVMAVRWMAQEALNVEIDVYNLSGQKIAPIFHGEINGGMMYSIPFDSDVLATGIYIVIARSAQGTFSEKLIIR